MSWADVLLLLGTAGIGAVVVMWLKRTRPAEPASPILSDLPDQVLGQSVTERLFDGPCSGYRAEQEGKPSLLLRLHDTAAPMPTKAEVQAFLEKWRDVKSAGLIPMVKADARPSGLWILVPWMEVQPWKRFSSISAEERFDRGQSFLDALASLHEQGVVHGRVTPAWVLVQGGRVLLMPPAPIHRDPRQLQTLHSSALYLPPEEIKGDHAESFASDQYGAGVTLAMLLEAQQIYQRQSDFMGLVKSKLESHFNLRFEPPVPDALVPVLQRMLAPRPEDRFPSVADARAAYLASIGR